MTGRQDLQVLGGLRVAVGALWLVGLAGDVAACGAALPRAGRTAATALAVRDLVQGAALVARPEAGPARAGAAVDVVHALSMLPLVAASPRYRAAAAVSAVTAAAWAAGAAGIAAGRTRP